jgi:YVTN family beta-propeller protein
MRTGNSVARLTSICALAFISEAIGSRGSTAAEPYRVFVSNERSGDVTIIDGTDWAVIATVAVGKRPRGIHPSPDGRRVYVTLSGSPLGAPPELDAHGNPIFKKGGDDDDTDEDSDKSADGIGVLDAAGLKLEAQFAAGSDPEEFAVSRDGKYLYVSNEDTKSASVVNTATGKVEHIIPVTEDPEGVAVTPDGTQFYVTCESAGDVFAINASSYAIVGRFKVEPRPRSVAFLPAAASLAFVPSESVGQINVIDTKRFQVLKVIQLPTGSRPMKVLLAPDARHLYVSNGRTGSISVLDTRTNQLVAEIKAGKRPWGLAISPDGKYLFTANGPSNDVSVIDLETNREIKRIGAGASPWGVTVVKP